MAPGSPWQVADYCTRQGLQHPALIASPDCAVAAVASTYDPAFGDLDDLQRPGVCLAGTVLVVQLKEHLAEQVNHVVAAVTGYPGCHPAVLRPVVSRAGSSRSAAPSRRWRTLSNPDTPCSVPMCCHPSTAGSCALRP